MSQIDELKAILEQHVGKDNKITSREVQEHFGIREDASHPKSRKLIKDCMMKYHLPLAANSRGYYIVTSDDEYAAYIENLQNRADEILERKDQFIRFYQGSKKEEKV